MRGGRGGPSSDDRTDSGPAREPRKADSTLVPAKLVHYCRAVHRRAQGRLPASTVGDTSNGWRAPSHPSVRPARQDSIHQEEE
jgi:hypothetical protein